MKYRFIQLRFLFSTITLWYNLKKEDDEFLPNHKQTVLNIERKEDEEARSSSKSDNTRSLPSWMKRLPSEHDLKNSSLSPVSEKEKVKKKPKLI
jgi:hypothetical protein